MNFEAGKNIGEYTINNILGSGAYTDTYYALKEGSEKYYAIKEYLPGHLCFREFDTEKLRFHDSDTTQERFDSGLARFISVGRILCELVDEQHPNVVNAIEIIESHDTAFLVLEYQVGKTLQEWLASGKSTLEEKTIVNILLGVLDGLEWLESHDIHIEGLNPRDIIVSKGKLPIICDFYSLTGENIGNPSNEHYQLSLRNRYIPLEHPSFNPDSDIRNSIYSIGIICREMILQESPKRKNELWMFEDADQDNAIDLLTERNLPYYSQKLLELIDDCSALDYRIRVKTYGEIRQRVNRI